MTSSSRPLTDQNRYPISSSKGRLNPIFTYNPLSIGVHSSINSTSEWQHPTPLPIHYITSMKSLVVLVHLKSVIFGLPHLSNLETLVD
ncbi:hypothetical protein QL285_038599 [Trifolium repens]|nr:hypothetical protein QL285_038599 [Trifolium repens]